MDNLTGLIYAYLGIMISDLESDFWYGQKCPFSVKILDSQISVSLFDDWSTSEIISIIVKLCLSEPTGLLHVFGV